MVWGTMNNINSNGGNPSATKPDPIDILVILNNQSISYTYANALRRFNLDTKVLKEEDASEKINIKYQEFQPKATIMGSKYFNKNATNEQKNIRKETYNWYLKRVHVEDENSLIIIPLILAQEKELMEDFKDPYPKVIFKKLILPESPSVERLDSLINKEFRKILHELNIQIPAFDNPEKAAEDKKSIDSKYSAKDFSAYYAKGEYTITMKGPIVELSDNKLKSCIDDRTTMLDLRMSRKILTLDWAGISYFGEELVRKLYNMLKDYITKNDSSGAPPLKEIHMTGFKEKSSMITNKNMADFYNKTFKIIS